MADARSNNIPSFLLIGGTGDAVQINEALSDRSDLHLITSLAGRTVVPAALKGEVLPDGFTDHGGLEEFLKQRKISAVIDATHPFAEIISQKALCICQKRGITYLRYERPPWEKTKRDNWIIVPDMAEAVSRVGLFERVFLSVGRQEAASFEGQPCSFFLLRSIEPVAFSSDKAEVVHILNKGPFTLEKELALLAEHRIDVLVSKNSGGQATYPKIEAARKLDLPIIMIDRPQIASGGEVSSLTELEAELRLSF
ncbi:MAG: cobalt-precorrin-6A reductase [Sneathiella sp.]